MNSIFEYLNKELHNPNITSTLIDTRLSTLTIDGKLEIKYPLGKASYGLKAINKALESCKSKTPTSSPSLSSPLNYETPMIESNKDTVRDIYCSLEEKVNLFTQHRNHCYETFHRRSNVNYKAVKKDSTLKKSSCDHNSEIARLTEENA